MIRIISYLLLINFISCTSQTVGIEIDKSVQKELELNKKADEMSDLIEGTNSYFTFSSKGIEKLFGVEDSISSIQKMLSKTDEIMPMNVCNCQLKNDTITLTGGIFYGGGIGYQVKIVKKKFNGQIVLASNGKKYKKEKSDDLTKELFLDSEKQKLYLTKEPVFELGEIMTGKIVMESQDFFSKSKDGLANDKCWMKVVFECKLNKHGPL